MNLKNKAKGSGHTNPLKVLYIPIKTIHATNSETVNIK